ncbi:hypothetical protein IFM51744_00014 [Aspergillus udagawae]|nr:hypothetical protein IFM51744_00014 [Aspergillus udagawae]
MEYKRITSFITRVRSLKSKEEQPEPLIQVRKYPVFKDKYWEPCLMLYRARIPYKAWSDRDVLIAHGAAHNEGFRELHLLVNDVEKAAQTLQEGGYLRTALSFLQGDLGIPESEISKTCRLVSPTALDEGIARCRRQTSRDPAEILADIRKGHEWLDVRGVALLAAESWAYGPIGPEDEEPIPELHEYFNSHVALWLAGSSKKRVQDMYVQSVIAIIITELDEAWSNHEKLVGRLRAWALGVGLLSYEEFRDYHRSRIEREMNLQDLPCPFWSHGFVRERPRLMIERRVERSGGCPDAVIGYKAILPRFTWLVKIPAGKGWIQISMNVFQVIKNRHSKRASAGD